jgi:hypothetical protein
MQFAGIRQPPEVWIQDPDPPIRPSPLPPHLEVAVAAGGQRRARLPHGEGLEHRGPHPAGNRTGQDKAGRRMPARSRSEITHDPDNRRPTWMSPSQPAVSVAPGCHTKKAMCTARPSSFWQPGSRSSNERMRHL